MNRLHFITLGTRDLEKSKAFFRELFGWNPTMKDSKDVAFFDMGGSSCRRGNEKGRAK